MLTNLAILLVIFTGGAAFLRYVFGVGVATPEENEAAFKLPKSETTPTEQYSAPIGPEPEETKAAVIPEASPTFRGAPRYDLYDAPGVPSISSDVQTPPSETVASEPVETSTTNSPQTVATINEAMTIISAATLLDEVPAEVVASLYEGPAEAVVSTHEATTEVFDETLGTMRKPDDSAPSYLMDILPTVEAPTAFSASERPTLAGAFEMVPDATGEPSIVRAEMRVENWDEPYDYCC